MRRRRVLIAFGAILLLLSVGIVYELRQSAMRISHIQVFDADQSLADLATRAMQGDYFGIIPRDSIFFFPAARIRADIIAAHPDIAAVSIFQNGLTSISIKANARVPIARWCGASPENASRLNLEATCYLFDAGGFIFAAAASSTETINAFALYAPLEADTLVPVRATLAHADKLPGAFDFARQLGTFGSPVSSVVFRADEVDDRLESGTRVTYVLGEEQSAFTALVSSRGHLNLADGSLEYVDLRFAGATYIKRKK